jgi:hypothetical protein
MKTRWLHRQGVLFLVLLSGTAAGGSLMVPAAAVAEERAVAVPASTVHRLTAADYVQLHRTRSEIQPLASPRRSQKTALPKAAGQS